VPGLPYKGQMILQGRMTWWVCLGCALKLFAWSEFLGKRRYTKHGSSSAANLLFVVVGGGETTTSANTPQLTSDFQGPGSHT